MASRTVCHFILLLVLLLNIDSILAQGPNVTNKTQVRTALVIGIGNYSLVQKLGNPANDAKDIGVSLNHLHFKPQVHVDDKATDLRKHIEDWANSIPHNCDIALFYFAGHGLQENGENYIFPTDGTGASDELLKRTTYKLSDILGRMKASGAKLNILILDACRLPPEPRGLNASKFHKGLAAMNPSGNGTLICFSTEANKASSDGPQNGHSEYTQALLEYLEVPGLTVLKMLERVHDRVFYKKDIDQNPCIYSSVGEEFDFCLSPASIRTGNEIAKGNQPFQDFQESVNSSSSAEKDHLFKHAVDTLEMIVRNVAEKLRQSLGPNDVYPINTGYQPDFDNYTYDHDWGLVSAYSKTNMILPKFRLALDGIVFKFRMISDNKMIIQPPKPDLLARFEYLHNLDSTIEKEYSIYAIQWAELEDTIRTYFLQRTKVLQKNGVPIPSSPEKEVDTFTNKKISEFRSASNSTSKLNEQNDRKLFDALYQAFKTVATGIKDSLGGNFIYHEDDIQRDYKAHTFYYGIGIKSIDIQDKWLVPIFSGGIRKDSLYMQIATYANPRLSTWENNNGLSHEEKISMALSNFNWDDLARRTRKFIAARLDILR